MTYQARLDQCGDETSMGHGGYSESGSGLTSIIMNKPGITKGMQTALISHVYRNRLRACLHHHKVNKYFPNHIAEKWTSTQGGREVRRVLGKLKLLIDGEASDVRRQIFPSKPHSTWGDFFLGDCITKYCGKNGYPIMCKVSHHDHRANVGWFFEPITMVKEYKEEGVEHTRLHISFQSTGATNIQGVNCFNENMRFVKKREREDKK